MSKDAVSDYQRLGEQLEHASKSLQAGRRRVSKTAPNLSPLLETAAASKVGHPLASETFEEPSFRPSSESVNESAAEGEVGVAERADEPTEDSGNSHPDGLVALETVAADVAAIERSSDATTPEARSEATGIESVVDLAALEALVFSTRHPLTVARLGELIDIPSGKALRQAIAELNRTYESAGRTFRIEQVAGGYQMLTLPIYGTLLNKLHQREIDSKLSRSAVETLAIIAYKQPVLRAEVEAIRGVASGETIRSLMEKHLVKIAGRAEEPGRPILYGTTKRFLELFGLNTLKELPKDEQPRPAGTATASKPQALEEPPANEPAATPAEPAPPEVEPVISDAVTAEREVVA